MSHSSELDSAPDAAARSSKVTEPVSKRRQKRALDRRITEKAVEIDKTLNSEVQKAAEELDISPEQLKQRFALVAPPQEQRKAMWWNGFISECADKWKAEYEGHGRGLLPWVAQRAHNEGLYHEFTDEQKAEYAEKAFKKREESKSVKAASITRKKAVAAVSEQLKALHQELQRMSLQAGVEFALFVTRSNLSDELDPFYVASENAATFLQGHMRLPPKELLTLMDLYSIGGVGAMAPHVKNQKEAYRLSVRTKLNLSYCDALKERGHDTTTFRHISYSNYDKIVYDFKIVLRGYPLTPNGQMVQISNLPGGIPGLVHVDTQLASGAWGFEAIEDSTYEPWKTQYDAAKALKESLPATPYIPVPETVFKPNRARNTSEDAGGSTSQQKRKPATSKPAGGINKRVKGDDPQSHGQKKAKRKVMSKETIESSSDEEQTEQEATDSEDMSWYNLLLESVLYLYKLILYCNPIASIEREGHIQALERRANDIWAAQRGFYDELVFTRDHAHHNRTPRETIEVIADYYFDVFHPGIPDRYSSLYILHSDPEPERTGELSLLYPE
ncbi:hypothetical protein RhiJN_28709 [Ceratobasidium sp. AG-Ba]|nr:hypothetical protein RhiJN_28709 [Ceratobasidium sp. AG-Ba]